MPISRGQMNRQLYGVGSLVGREKFGIGSKLKRFVRKIIPNEVADVAVKAAPFVAPFNPALGGAMAGLGSFDQSGSISKGVKSGLLNYGLGQGARYLGGAGVQGNPFEGKLFSSPLGTDTGIGKFLDQRKAAEVGQQIEAIEVPQYEELFAPKTADVSGVVSKVDPSLLKTSTEATTSSAFKKSLGKITSGSFTEMGQGLKELGGQGLKAVFTKPVPGSPDKTQIDKLAIGATIAGGVSYLDAKKLAEEAELVDDADEYTEEMYEADKARYSDYYADIITPAAFGLKEGGRVKYQSGSTPFGVPSITLDEKDEDGIDLEALKKEVEENPTMVNEITNIEFGVGKPGPYTDQGPYIKVDEEKEIEDMLNELDRELNKKADGGRIGFNNGSFGIMESIKAGYGKGMDKSIPKIKRDEDLTRDEIAKIKMSVFEVLDQTAGGDRSTLSGGFIDNLGDALEQISRPDLTAYIKDYTQGTGIFSENFIVGGKEDILKKADGGRIGFFEGSDDPSDPKFSPQGGKGIIEMDPLKSDLEEIKGGGGGIGGLLSPFTRAEKSFLFKTLAKQGGSDRTFTMPQLYRIFKNPGKFKKDESALKAFLKVKGFKDGGRIGFSEGTPSKRDELVERFGVKSDLLKKVYPLFMDEDGDYRKALQIAKYELGKFISGKGTDLDTGAEWYNKLDEDTQREILKEKIDIRNNRQKDVYDKFGFKPSPQMVEEMEMPVYDEEYAGKYGIGGKYATGGIARLGYAMGSEVPVRKNQGGITELDYRNTGGFVPVGIKEKADDVPAMLSKNEFVMTADAVRGIGNGDVETGAQKLYKVMKQAEKQGIA